jgi:hypothetical protein
MNDGNLHNIPIETKLMALDRLQIVDYKREFEIKYLCNDIKSHFDQYLFKSTSQDSNIFYYYANRN